MRIMLTNDDGIDAPGLRALLSVLEHHGDVTVIAPADGQSATSHSLSFSRPLLVSEQEIPGHGTHLAVAGRPADCTRLGLRSLFSTQTGVELPDLVVSGMNAGANAGVNVAYSGTVAAAMEAAFHGVPAIAVSLMLGGGPPNFARAAEIANTWLPQLIGQARAGTVLNLNLPPVRADDTPVMPLTVCRVNRSVHDSRYERRHTPWGEDYYWILGSGISFREVEPGSDVEALNAGRASLSPLRWDPVCYDNMDGLKEAF